MLTTTLSAALLLTTLLAPLISAQPPANFSGSWLRTSRTCQPVAKSNGFFKMIVEHDDPTLKVTIVTAAKGSERKLALTYKTTGEPIHYTGLDGDDFRSSAAWRGHDLVFQIAELEKGGQIHSEELWTLPEASKTLSVTKTESGKAKHSSCTSTFVNQ